MRIALSGLSSSPLFFEHSAAAADYLEDAATFREGVFIRAGLRREGSLLRLSLTAELPGHFTCDRCLQPFVRQHYCRDDFFFAFEEEAGSITSEEISLIPRNAVELDISQEIRDLIILSLPYQTLCREDCRGLCPHCGVNLNREECRCQEAMIDPRWEALRALQKAGSSEV